MALAVLTGLSGTASAQGIKADLTDAIPELAIAMVSLAGMAVLIPKTREIGWALGKAFNFIKLGLLLLCLSFLWVAMAELKGIEETRTAELVFEGLSILSVMFVAMGPYYFAEFLKSSKMAARDKKG